MALPGAFLFYLPLQKPHMGNIIRFDWAVKRLLRNKANFFILEGFLSELLGEDIIIENVLESEGNRQTSDNKTNRVDILVQDSRGELVIIEVQNNYMADYLLRMYFGTSKITTDNMMAGMPYSKVKKVISINIVYFDLGQGDDYVYHGTTNFVGLHTKGILRLTPEEEDIYQTDKIAKLYPEYYIIKVNQFNNVAKDTLDEWINFFKNQEVKDGTRAKGLERAKEELDVMTLSPDERIEYEAYIKDWRDNLSVIEGNYKKGLAEGKIEGMIEGKMEVTLKLYKRGMEIADISEITGLSEVEVRRVIDNSGY